MESTDKADCPPAKKTNVTKAVFSRVRPVHSAVRQVLNLSHQIKRSHAPANRYKWVALEDVGLTNSVSVRKMGSYGIAPSAKNSQFNVVNLDLAVEGGVVHAKQFCRPALMTAR